MIKFLFCIFIFFVKKILGVGDFTRLRTPTKWHVKKWNIFLNIFIFDSKLVVVTPLFSNTSKIYLFCLISAPAFFVCFEWIVRSKFTYFRMSKKSKFSHRFCHKQNLFIVCKVLFICLLFACFCNFRMTKYDKFTYFRETPTFQYETVFYKL